jgi:hypothetical protein
MLSRCPEELQKEVLPHAVHPLDRGVFVHAYVIDVTVKSILSQEIRI